LGRSLTVMFVLSASLACLCDRSLANGLDRLAPLPGACRIFVRDIDFGQRDFHAGHESVPLDVSVTCPAGLRYRLSLEGNRGCGTMRQLPGRETQTSSRIAYDIVTASGASLCGSAPGVDVARGIGTGAAQFIELYILVPHAEQFVQDGGYSDSFSISVRTER